MRRSSATIIVALIVPWLLFVTQETPAQGEIIYGISTSQGSNQIFSFDNGSPNALLSSQRITGFVDSNERLAAGGIDIRPANGKLYGLGQNGHIYTVDPFTGIATLVSTIHSAQPLSPFFFAN